MQVYKLQLARNSVAFVKKEQLQHLNFLNTCLLQFMLKTCLHLLGSSLPNVRSSMYVRS